MSTHNAQLAALLDTVVNGAGLVLEDVVVTSVGRRRQVRVVVDLTDDEVGSVDLDRVAQVSRAVGDALDASDALGPQPYSLEVTTPGVDRPLTQRRHWLRARTRLVRVERDGEAPLTGRLLDVGDDGPVLDVDGQQVVPGWDGIRKGVVEVEFTRRDAASGPRRDEADGHDGHDETDETDETDEKDEREEA
ncbi:ribosome maturation factor RimP [Jannaschia sp. R86511]|uniref:ribosome maturation factor RimP n=1 Tax=Jannaschia sp. R86511 TaxID=3093853 RepID=UPI0036D41A43